ncbi:MAG: hypothetical protein JXB88_13160 [Spirochaetales bacterium]|nr:hypothetical protein [Spirochaetales bacterium]
MKQKKIIVFFILITALSHSQSIEIVPKSQSFIESFPGEKVIVAFLVKNKSFSKSSFISELQLPYEWNIVTPDIPFELDENQGEVRILSFTIPGNALPGTHTLTYIVKGISDASLFGSYSFQIKVLPGINIDVSIIKSPEYVNAGEEIITSFLITNKSGTELHIEFYLYSNENFPMYLLNNQSTLLDFAPDESKTVDVVVQTDPGLLKSIKHNLELSFFLLDKGIKQKPVIITATVEVFPREMKEKIVYHTFPLEMTVKHSEQVYKTWAGDFVFNLSGYGSLYADKNYLLDFTLNKRIEIPEDSFLDDEDEYTLTYKSTHLNLYLGDHFYTVSPLMEEYCYGRGIMGRVKMGNFSLGGLYHESQWDDPPEEHVAGFMDIALKKDPAQDDFNYKLALNCFSEIDNTIIAGVYQQFKPSGELTFSCDAIAGNHFNDNWKVACNTDGKWVWNWFEFVFDVIFAQPDCPGEYDDTFFVDTTIGIYFFDDSLKITPGYKYKEQNIKLSDDFSLAMLEKTAKLGLGYQFKKTFTYISLDWELTHSLDQSYPSYVEDLRNNFTIIFNHPVGILTFYLLAFLEIKNDEINSKTTFQQQYIASIGLKAGKKIQYTLSCNFTDSYYLGTDLELDIGMAYQFNEKNKLLVNILYDYVQIDPDLLEYDCYADTENGHAFTLSIGYNVKFSIPISRKKIE